MIIRLDFIREAFDTAMLVVMDKQFGKNKYEWAGINYSKELNQSLPHIVSGFQPGRVTSQELGGIEALALRDGVYIVTFSIPPKKTVDTIWEAAGELEAAFRRKPLVVETCTVWCDEPYTENRGTDPEQGRYLISTTIPWSVVY